MKLIHEPLVHFLALGALVFALHAAVSRDGEDREGRRISVSAAHIDQLKALWQKQWQRPPTAEELRRLIDDHVRERVLYREALRLGLDKDDTILRRRLAQKMEFLIADLSLPVEPSEEALRAHYRENSERYFEPHRLSFSHVYFSPDARGEQVEIEARAALETLRRLQAGASGANRHGDPFLLRDRYEDVSLDTVSRDFGEAFAAALVDLAPERWHGPIASGYGMHLVYLDHVQTARLRDFSQVRQQVENDYLFELRVSAQESAYRSLREGYDIVVEETGATAAGPGAR